MEARGERDVQDREDAKRAIRLAHAQADDRMNRLTDAYIDRHIDKGAFERCKRGLLDERADLNERLDKSSAGAPTRTQRAQQKFELIKSLLLSDSPAIREENLSLPKSASSKLSADGKNVVVNWDWPFNGIALREQFTCGAPQRDNSRTAQEDVGVAQNECADCNPGLGWVHDWFEAIWQAPDL